MQMVTYLVQFLVLTCICAKLVSAAHAKLVSAAHAKLVSHFIKSH
jgi:hypothetical protein